MRIHRESLLQAPPLPSTAAPALGSMLGSTLGSTLGGAARARRLLALELLEAALEAVDPERATSSLLTRLRREGSLPDRIDALFALGKAALPMSLGALRALEIGAGLIVAPTGSEASLPPGLHLLPSSHPLPDARALRSGERLLREAALLGEGQQALCLISGGGSAMAEAPAPGLALGELRRVSEALLLGGADIEELNAVRCAFSRLKGGGLARALAPAAATTVVLSDVPGLPPSVVASGPTASPPEGMDPREILERYGLYEGLSTAARRTLAWREPGDLPERPLRKHPLYVAADNARARLALIEAARARGLALAEHEALLGGEAREAGPAFLYEARERCAREGLDGLVAGGETEVVVRGRGRGGRNQEAALASLASIEEGELLAFFGTDGVDGRSAAAGALVDTPLLGFAGAIGLDPLHSLADNDSEAFFERAGGSLRTGPTGTNVADLALYLCDGQRLSAPELFAG